LNRIDDIIMFKSLKREHIHTIIDLELDRLFERVKSLGYGISLTEKAKDFIAERGFDEKFGARPLKRAIQKYLEDPLAEQIISAKLKVGDTIEADYDETSGEITVHIKKGTTKKPKKTATEEGPAPEEE